ncbi:MAG: hypothetical protein ACJAZW_001679 [Maritalea sp.]|jgi:hypothetical protein
MRVGCQVFGLLVSFLAPIGNVTLAIPVRDTVGFDAKARGPKISFNVVGQF